MQSALVQHRCKICESTNVRVYARKQKVVYYICKDCLCIYEDPPVDSATRILYANEEYQGGVYQDYVEAREMKLDHFRGRLKTLHRVISEKPLTMLDIGCGCGYFMEVASAFGHDVHGLEFSARAIAAAPELVRPKIFQADVETLSRCNAQLYDLVVAFDLIEHLDDPIGFLKQVNTLLKEGGSVAVTTPDTKHFLRSLMGSHWPPLAPMQHLCLFSRDSISIALQKAGFRIQAMQPAFKVLSIDYLMRQIRIHNPIIFGAYKLLRPVLPNVVISRHIRVNIGELFAVAQKI